MATLVSGNIRIDIVPLKTTLKNYAKLKEQYENLKSIAKPDREDELKRAFGLLQKVPQLLEFIDVDGNFNQATIARETERLGNVELAVKYVQGEINMAAARNPDVALGLFFPPLTFQPIPEVIAVCINAIRETVDMTLLEGDAKKHLKSSVDSAFWQNVESDGVIEYCDNFCKTFK